MLSRYFSNPIVRGGKRLTIHVTKGALATIKIKPAAAKDGVLGDHYRMAQLELSASEGLTMKQYRKKLDENLAQTEAQLNSIFGRAE